jgi:protein arginine N-methyltransferase 1
MYSLEEFGDMIADASRFGAYREAIARAVRPGDTVVDLGCGPGILALLACRAGARRVYAIESGEVIEFGRQLAAANGFEERIQFIHGDSRKLQLPERVDVLVSDVRGALPFFRDGIRSVEDARQRFLAGGGQLVPQRDTLYATLVEAGEFYKRITAPWQNPPQGLDLSLSLPLILNHLYQGRMKPEQLLTEPQAWCQLDYVAGASPRASAELEFVARRDGTAHGICLWFETQLFDQIGFSCAPDAPETVYGHVLLPLLAPVKVVEGQKIEVTLHADPGGADYVWRWSTSIASHNGTESRSFQQSTLEGASFSERTLRRHSAEFVPVLSEAGEAERWLLQAMDGKTSLQEVAQSAVERFPGVFSRWEEAFRRAAELADRVSR